MANYHYDEGGNMAAYFIITFLALTLIPLTLSMSLSSKKDVSGCQCQPCVDQRARVSKRERGSLLYPRIGLKTSVVILGWSLFGYLTYKVTNASIENKVYDPFEILGLRTGVSEKEIKSHFKKLSRIYHPDKVKATVNETIEDIASRFVEITKAYKSLTDETIRRNWEQYGHPDGRQEITTGIALPKWIVEGRNNIWVLGVYGLVFGGALPALVGRWWFGSREKTKDGIHAKTAASFFKSLSEESGMHDVVGLVGKSYQWEGKPANHSKDVTLAELEVEVKRQLEEKWSDLKSLTDPKTQGYERRRRALVLLFAHVLRIPVTLPSLAQEQIDLLLNTPVILNALLNISISRNWLLPSLEIMRLHAFLAQALPPGEGGLRYAQLPGINTGDIKKLDIPAAELDDFIFGLEKKGDKRVSEVKKAANAWGRLEVVDCSFKVIGERSVAPSSIVFFVVKLRILPPGSSNPSSLNGHDGEIKQESKSNEDRDDEFLSSRKDVEDLPTGASLSRWAHAPYWPTNRKSSWWIVVADDKSNKTLFPPLKITDVPVSDPTSDRNYRSYKLQFQAPQTVGLFTWKVYFVSDTFVGEEVTKDVVLKVENISVQEDEPEDEISDPEEDTLAGQMAAMRGGSVKKRTEGDSDEESSTDDDKGSDSSDSDSD